MSAKGFQKGAKEYKRVQNIPKECKIFQKGSKEYKRVQKKEKTGVVCKSVQMSVKYAKINAEFLVLYTKYQLRLFS